MRMGFIFSGAFWGVLLILAGISVLVKVFFQIDIPVFRIVFGFLVIAWGVSILTGRPFFTYGGTSFSGHRDEENIVFGDGEFKPNKKNKYNVVFGRGVTDLSTLGKDALGSVIEVNTVFSDNTVYLDKSLPVHIEVNSAFAGAILPDGNTAAFGSYHYRSPGFEKAKSHIRIEANVVFGALKVVLK